MRVHRCDKKEENTFILHVSHEKSEAAILQWAQHIVGEPRQKGRCCFFLKSVQANLTAANGTGNVSSRKVYPAWPPAYTKKKMEKVSGGA